MGRSTFPRDHFPPGFFDLPASAGETLPVAIIGEWTTSAQTADVARALLAPHVLSGIVVSTDSAGLTRLGRERPLIEILALIGHPKEIIHACGRAVGGRALGVWAADNTQMFYPAAIAAERVVSLLRTTMERIRSECELGIGMAAHAGDFFELSGGVYGTDAARVETVAEEHTEGGEFVVTDDVVRLLPAAHGFVFEARVDLAEKFGGVFRVTEGLTIPGLIATDIDYPTPYSSDFSTQMAEYTHTRRDSRMPRQAYQELTVVVAECEPEVPDVPEVAVLNDLAITAAMKRIGRSLLESLTGMEVKTAGLLGIYTFADSRTAIEFARRFRDAFAERDVQCRIGIDAGPVLVFDLGGGSHDIAGSAVNVASKLAQDVGEYGRIQFSDAVAQRVGAGSSQPMSTYKVSGVELHAYDA